MRESRKYVFGAALLAVMLFAAACGSGGDDDSDGGDTGGGGEEKASLTVGAVGFAENQIVAEMYAAVLENAGYEVDRQTSLESREIIFPALQDGEIDIAPEYLSSLYLFINPDGEASGDADEVYQKLGDELEGVELLEYSEANDTNAFVVTQETADEFGLSSVSDLADVAGELTLGGPPECPERPFCIPGLQEVYGVEFGNFQPLDVGGPLTVEALDGGQVDVALLFSTSSVIGDKGWVVLEDDQELQNAENIVPAVNADVLDDEIRELLNAVSAELTTENITELNGRVELQQEDPSTVAEEFLTEAGLL